MREEWNKLSDEKKKIKYVKLEFYKFFIFLL